MNKHKISLRQIVIFFIQFILFIGFLAGVVILFLNVNKAYAYLALVLLYVLNVIFVFIIYAQNREQEAKLSWIYLVMLIPIIGHAIFIGYGLIFRNNFELEINNDSKYQLLTYKNEILGNNKLKPYNDLKQIQNINQNILLPANFDFFAEGYRFYDDLFASLKKAQKTIYIVTYIIKKSEITTEFLDTLEQKANNGVKIKWLVDDFGAMLSQKKQLRRLDKHPNIEIKLIGKIYYPFINAASFSRNHEKFIIIDNKVVFSGGNNISDEYSSMSKKYGHWIDLNYRITGPYINSYIIHFIKYWKFIAKKDIDVHSSLFIDNDLTKYHNQALLVTDSPSYTYSESELFFLKMIPNAKKSIKIATPYFSVSRALKKQLILALKSGVEVTIFFPGLPDKKLVYKIGLYQLSKLQQHGLKILIYEDHFLHTKAGLIDDKYGWVGTNNWDSRSMYSQYETMDIFEGKSIAKLNEIFSDYEQKCQNVENFPQFEKKPTVIEKFLYDISKPLI
ncbi:phospholipase D-like domain-containing protein [Mycoplasmopsis verecunda]|uniref:Cardiolipin synthase n=1 Tax=Mycoplasmopsis verecunda TaxID=171291 RepID=A0A1T4L1P8_9BACT|nr:phosphatidylserine/phosphatidylglycerophosphate/cardiolipin synthase family protein [Mycoplasmopsis verecunda]WPB54389.1 phosphatidylserine/phosphatidylglycerophosphate/cardiolipin synthase family protein [Mycoplasmopsis verecunda]SJZ48467.1 cardiolipin synthase [Mycoplasmopsis verecunda]